MKENLLKTTVKPTYQPVGDRIVATPVEAESKTASGILLAEQSKEKTELADVVAVGPDVEEVQIGDRIVYVKYGPHTIKDGGTELLILQEDDCLAVVK